MLTPSQVCPMTETHHPLTRIMPCIASRTGVVHSAGDFVKLALASLSHGFPRLPTSYRPLVTRKSAYLCWSVAILRALFFLITKLPSLAPCIST